MVHISRIATQDPLTTKPLLTKTSRREMPGDPQCNVCKGLGYVRFEVDYGDPLFGKLEPCACWAKERQEQNIAALVSIANLMPDEILLTLDSLTTRNDTTGDMIRAALQF